MSFDPSTIITILLIVLCSLAALDLWKQYAINTDDYWFYKYTMAVRSSTGFWKLGFRLEDLEKKAEAQQQRWHDIRRAVEQLAPRFSIDPTSLRHNLEGDITHTRLSRVAMHNLLNNDTAVFQIRCESAGPILRVGVNDFRTDERDVCQIFASANLDEKAGPQSMFEMVPLDEDAFGLRLLGNDRFLRSVPPPADSAAAPWKIVVGAAVAGNAERFRMSDEGYLYSSIMAGFFQCSGGQMVKGFGGKYGTVSKFKLEAIPDTTLRKALEVVHLSDQLIAIQKEYTAKHQSTTQARKEAVNMVVGSENPNPVHICLGVPMTSKGTKMDSVVDSPFWTNLFDSFMKSIDWRSNRYVFKFYLGLDKKDELYDIGDSWNEMREEFRNRAVFRMKELLMDDADIDHVLLKMLGLKLMHFDHLEGAPTQVVSQLMLAAYVDNFDYFYQVNDDTIIVTPNWPPKLIESLVSNPSIPNFGVTGPLDTNNDKIFTHAFVHRTHIEVFGHLFPTSFKNWWSDDWISTVYGSEHTFRSDVEIKHNVGAQKVSGYTRYEIDQGAQLRLEEELRKGHVQIDEWLKKNNLPRLPLPNVCGFVPMAKFLTTALRKKDTKDTAAVSSPLSSASYLASSPASHNSTFW